MTRIGPALPLMLLVALAGPSAAQDEQIISMYTKLELETRCSFVKPDSEEEAAQAAEFWCEGYRGMPVRVVEGDLRYYLGYGLKAKEQCSSRQTLAPFNTIGKTLEWRLVREFPGHMTPIATILRYRTDSDGRTGEYLVVTKIGKDDSCHVAYVDARALPDANQLARDAADRFAQDFVCGRDEPFMMTPSGPAEVDIMLGRSGCR
jgi:hypothetical protein